MHLDNIENEDSPRVEQYLSKIKVIRQIAHKLIDFLAQIEDFQKKLWIKKKFVVETNYCITLDRIPEELYPEIAANGAQREEWVRLFAIDEIASEMFVVPYSDPLTVEFLEANPFLLVDTKFFDAGFKYRFLSSFDDFENNMDGLLINSENFQALNSLKARYKEAVKCIHIDPPYNTASSGFLYKNNFQHSSWLSMMNQTYLIASQFLVQNGVLQCHIDEYELERLHLLFDSNGIRNAGTMVWDKGTPVTGAHGLATQHEYVLWRSKENIPVRVNKENISQIVAMAKEMFDKYGGPSEEALRDFRLWLRNNKKLSKSERTYNSFDENGKVFRSDNMSATDRRQDEKFYVPLFHPDTQQPCPIPNNGWRYTPDTMKDSLQKNLILFGHDHATTPRRKSFIEENLSSQMPSIFFSGMRGKMELDRLGVEFPFAHPTYFYKYLISSVSQKRDIVLDYFAGSGTTGHSVIDQNRSDASNRKYILIEMGTHFDSVLKPRIQKVIYSEDWRGGKPVSRNGSSHAFKYIKLESYEDTLNNLELQRTEEQTQTLLGTATFREDYLLHYMLYFESKGSLLDLQVFDNPFDYQLKIASSTVGETVPTKVDLVETFNYLIGLQVRTIRKVDGIVMVEGQTRDKKNVLVIWRNTNEFDNEGLNTFFIEQFAEQQNEFDTIYVNGDNTLANIRSQGATWKVHLTEEEFHYRMFEG